MSQSRVLVVDDEPAFCTLCSRWLTDAGHEVRTAGDLVQAREKLEAFDADLILLDLALPPAFDPMETLACVPEFAGRPVIILTGHGDRSLALEAIRQGAWDLLAKPIDPDMLAVVVRRALTKHHLEKEVTRLRESREPDDAIRALVGVSPAMQGLRNLIQRIAPTQVRVLVTGPSGTGKEVVARTLHELSLRKQGPFVSVHCGAIPAELLESELFGHIRGAFTGADRDREGLLKMADGGTLFLDEIGEMPLPMQVKLLRVLQEGSFYPVGGRELVQIDVRVISATNASLPDKVAQGSFREDLFYRIRGVTLETRALNERPEDIPALLRHFAERAGQGGASLSNEVLSWFMNRSWPGNVRELKSTFESVQAVASGPKISLDDVALLYPLGADISASTEADPEAQAGLDAQVRALEIRLIRQALEENEGNRTQVAAQLRISRQGLLNKMERYGLNHY